MKVDTIDEAIALIRDAVKHEDYKQAAALERNLYLSVLDAIADVGGAAGEIAERTIKVEGILFPRWPR